MTKRNDIQLIQKWNPVWIVFSLSHELVVWPFLWPPSAWAGSQTANSSLLKKRKFGKSFPLSSSTWFVRRKPKIVPTTLVSWFSWWAGGQLVLASRTQNPKFYIVINEEDTKTIIANQLEGILIGLAMFLWHHNIISIVECSVVLLSTLTELVTKLLERQLFSCILTQCNFKQTSTESLSNKQKVVSVTTKRKQKWQKSKYLK